MRHEVAVLHAPVARGQRRAPGWGSSSRAPRIFSSASGSLRPCAAKKPRRAFAAEAGGALRGEARRVVVGRADPQAALCSGVLQRSQSQCARPMWSGCMCVTITRSTGRPPSSLANTCSHCALASSCAMQQSTTVQPSRPSSRSRSSHRLMWSSAKGSAMRIQRTPGASSRLAPGAGSVSPSGYCSFVRGGSWAWARLTLT